MFAYPSLVGDKRPGPAIKPNFNRGNATAYRNEIHLSLKMACSALEISINDVKYWFPPIFFYQGTGRFSQQVRNSWRREAKSIVDFPERHSRNLSSGQLTKRPWRAM